MKKSQAQRLLELLSDDRFHSTPEIQKVVYGGDHLGTARIASRASDLRKLGPASFIAYLLELGALRRKV